MKRFFRLRIVRIVVLIWAVFVMAAPYGFFAGLFATDTSLPLSGRFLLASIMGSLGFAAAALTGWIVLEVTKPEL